MNRIRRTARGGLVDRARTLRFTFDGVAYQGHPGDTLASALLANGIHLVGRSFKYHRPRGILASGPEEPNALMRVGEGARATPNLRATQVELVDGLVAESQNRWPSLSFDVGAVNNLLSSGLAAGFYYKTFMAPFGAWSRLYEPFIRRAAGLGHAPSEPDPDHYSQRFAHADVLVVGGGIAGLAAARAAAEAGADVLLCDENDRLGGGLLAESALLEGQPALASVEAAVADLAARPNVRILTRTQAFGAFAQNFVGLVERVTDHLAEPHAALPRERLWKVRAASVVLATGAIERPLVFPDNDRPGIMLAGAAQTYLLRYGVLSGERVVVFAACDSGYAAALTLQQAGATVLAILDPRSEPGAVALAAATAAGIPVRPRTVVTGTGGRLHIDRVRTGSLQPDGSVKAAGDIGCDLLLMAGGWTPSLHLHAQARGTLRFDATRQVYLPDGGVPNLWSSGACAGHEGLAQAFASGWTAGAEAAAAAGHTGAPPVPGLTVTAEIAPAGGFVGRVPHPEPGTRAKAVVDFQNDVLAADIGLAVQEGFRAIEHVKRYTTSGMATDQGKTANLNALAIAATAQDKTMPEVGLTTYRMPYTPVTFGAFAGHSRGLAFDPIRRTPLHEAALALGAVFEDVGQWKRARFFPRLGEDMAMAVARECRAVRERAGLFDASTLGKIEVVGPDALRFLERIYTNGLKSLAPGRCRYGLMLTETGFVMDDGIIARLDENRFHVTTTTGGAARVLAHMEDYLQTEFTDCRVALTSVTEQWATIALQGPLARELLAPLVEGIDLSAEAMPHMSVRTGTILGVPMRLFRASFTGERGYEVNVPAGYGQAVWDALWQAGQPHGLTAYGTEAMHVLRAEKGYIIVGQETDGTVTPGDLGLDWAVGKAKPDFVGKRSLGLPDLARSARKQLVGLLPVDGAIVPEEGAQVTLEASPVRGLPTLGHVTSAYASATLGRAIALGLVKDGRALRGQVLYVSGEGGSIPVEVVAPIFYDPDGGRLHG